MEKTPPHPQSAVEKKRFFFFRGGESGIGMSKGNVNEEERFFFFIYHSFSEIAYHFSDFSLTRPRCIFFIVRPRN